MTSAIRTSDRQGFTLIEIVMVLALAAVLFGGALGIMISSSDERTLKKVTGEVELMAKRAHTIAILHQTSYAIEFSPGMARLLPLAQTQFTELSAGSENTASSNVTQLSEKDRQVSFDEGVRVEIRRWNSEKWISLEKDAVEIWRFDPDGLCEPISVRAYYGKSWMEDTYHPLTGSSIPEEKSFELR